MHVRYSLTRLMCVIYFLHGVIPVNNNLELCYVETIYHYDYRKKKNAMASEDELKTKKSQIKTSTSSQSRVVFPNASTTPF